MSVARRYRGRRLVEHILSDPFIDMGFIYILARDPRRLDVLERQARIFIEVGDLGFNTLTYHKYQNEVEQRVADMFKGVYRRSLKKMFGKSLVESKARAAWQAVLTLFAFRYIARRFGLDIRPLFPETALSSLEALADVAKSFIEVKLKLSTSDYTPSSTIIARNTLKELESRGADLASISPILWWINIMMESKVFKAVFEYQYLVYSKRDKIKAFAEEIEGALSQMFEDREPDPDYALLEVLKALISRCIELRGQYINKLQNALLFVKHLRKGVKDPGRWDWFLKDDILTYVTSLYLVKLWELTDGRIEGSKLSLDVSGLVMPRHGPLAGPASALASFVLLSPLFLQYSLEASKSPAVTPADIVVVLLRLAKKHGPEDFSVSIKVVAQEVLEFWEEYDMLRRIKLYTSREPSPEDLYTSPSFTTSLALLIHSGISGIGIATRVKPVLRLPPRNSEFDAIYVQPGRLLLVTKKLWEV